MKIGSQLHELTISKVKHSVIAFPKNDSPCCIVHCLVDWQVEGPSVKLTNCREEADPFLPNQFLAWKFCFLQ